MRYSVDHTTSRFSKKDIILPLALILNVILFSFLFFSDLNKQLSVGEREVIGNVTFKINTLQRKFDSSMVWGSIVTNSPIADRDTIRTFEESDAVIKLKDGTEISVDENSLILIDMNNGIPNINFQSGSINLRQSKTSTPIVVHSDDQKLEFDEANLKLVKTKGSLEVFVDSGTVKATVNGEDKLLSANEIAIIDSRSITIKPTSLKLISPVNAAKFFTSGTRVLIPFEWSHNQFDSVFLEISKNRDFLYKKKISVTGKNSYTLSLKGGFYFWRLQGVSSNHSTYSESRKIIILDKPKIDLYLPLHNSEYVFKTRNPTINFSWSGKSIGTEYILEVSTSSLFQNSLLHQPLKVSSYRTDQLGEGTYFWRVNVLSKSINIPGSQSAVQSFTIARVKKYPTPELLNPRHRQTVVIDNVDNNQVLFNWRMNAEIKNFQIDISYDEQFQKILLSKQVPHPYYITKELSQKGTYYWRVRGLLSDKFTGYSQVSSFVVSDSLNISGSVVKNTLPTDPHPTEPKKVSPLFPIDHEFDLAHGKPLKFSWNSEAPADFYLFKIRNINHSKKPKEVFQTKVKNTEYAFKDFSKLEVGLFEWEVTPYKGSIAGKPSTNRFRIQFHDPLQSLHPADIQIISPQRMYKD
jgi:hypothetical protein